MLWRLVAFVCRVSREREVARGRREERSAGGGCAPDREIRLWHGCAEGRSTFTIRALCMDGTCLLLDHTLHRKEHVSLGA
eukprot:3060526-Prymnesium_polylepis.1